MKNPYEHIIMSTILFIFVLLFAIFSEYRRSTKKNKVLFKTKYDHKRLIAVISYIIYLMQSYHYYDRRVEYYNILQKMNQISAYEFEVYMKHLRLDTFITLVIFLLAYLVAIFIDIRSFGVMNPKGIQLDRFFKYEKFNKYRVDYERQFIELGYLTFIGHQKYRYLKMSEDELIQAVSIFDDKINFSSKERNV